MRILLAEDDTALSEAVVKILEKNNYSVDAVYDGLDALDYLREGNYDAAILDIMMPGLDGISVLKKIRAEGSVLPVLMLTAKSEVDDKVEGLDSGANDYMTKPFESKELLARLRVLTRTPAAADSKLNFGNLSLDRASYELTSPSGSFRLTGKEFQMLELLMANPGQLLSTDQLMEKVWGYDSDAEITVVWTYISFLRKKLAALKADVKIKVVRGAGYLLEKTE